MNIARLAGVFTGIVIGLIIVAVFLKVSNTNHRMKSDYDERQQVLRGRGYMYAFYAFLAYECIMLSISIAEITLPIPDYIVHFGGILISCTVLGCYCIWKDVYWGLNNDRRRYFIFFAVCIILNAIPVVGTLRTGSLVTNGELNVPVVNLMVLIMMLFFCITMLVRRVLNGQSEEDV